MFIVLPVKICIWYLRFVLTLTSGSSRQEQILDVQRKFAVMKIGEMMLKYSG